MRPDKLEIAPVPQRLYDSMSPPPPTSESSLTDAELREIKAKAGAFAKAQVKSASKKAQSSPAPKTPKPRKHTYVPKKKPRCLITTDTKYVICTRCRRYKLRSAFSLAPLKLNGLDSWCKSCHCEHASAYSRSDQYYAKDYARAMLAERRKLQRRALRARRRAEIISCGHAFRQSERPETVARKAIRDARRLRGVARRERQALYLVGRPSLTPDEWFDLAAFVRRFLIERGYYPSNSMRRIFLQTRTYPEIRSTARKHSLERIPIPPINPLDPIEEGLPGAPLPPILPSDLRPKLTPQEAKLVAERTAQQSAPKPPEDESAPEVLA